MVGAVQEGVGARVGAAPRGGYVLPSQSVLPKC